MTQLLMRVLIALLAALPTALLACPPLTLGLEQVASSIWIRPPSPNDPAGWTEPVVVWVDSENLWISDPGPHFCAGQALRTELKKRWPKLRHQLINSHSHPRNVLANSAWPKGTPVYALKAVAQQMKTRCPRCLSNLRTELGAHWMKGTRIVLPNRELRAGESLRMGQSNWRVIAHLGAHTEADLSLYDSANQRLYSPSLLAWQRVPDLARSSPIRWLSVLNEAPFSDASVIWLGHASSERSQADLKFTRAYLKDIWEQLSQAYEAGRSEHEFHDARELLPPSLQDATSLRQHSLNVQRVWRLLEQQDLNSSLR